MADKRGTGDDAFWDLTLLVPKKHRPTLESFAPGLTPPAFSANGAEESSEALEARTLHLGAKSGKTETFQTADNLFLTQVTLAVEKGDFNFYYRFAEDARQLSDAEAPEVPYTPFFSYMPQYSQMSSGQLAYYLFWRGELLKGRPLKCDEGYFYLFAYECINLTGVCLEPAEALDRLLILWLSYTETFPKVNKYLAEWVSDLCLIHRLALPKEKLKPLYPTIYKYAGFREFYFGGIDEVTQTTSEMLLALLSDYDPRSSRYVKGGGETADIFRNQLPRSMLGVFHEVFSQGGAFLRREQTVCRSHSAFCGALYARGERIRITVEYHPFSEVSDLREQVTSAVKYSENLLRAKLGIKSRLWVGPFPDSYRRSLDAYYRVIYNGPEKERQKPQEPDYMSQYNQAESGIDFARADEIEALSWETTGRLVSEEPEDAPAPATPSASAFSAPSPADEEALSRDACDYLRCVVCGDAPGAAQFLSRTDSLAEEINQYFLTYQPVGDVILAPGDTGYSLVEDYESEVKEWIQGR